MANKKEQATLMQVLSDKGLVASGAASTRILEVTLTAPEGGAVQRPLALALVIDRSGSMQGEKLHYAKQAAAHLVDMLSERDRAAVVMYDSEIDLVSPSLAMTAANRAQAKAAIQRITSRGATNLFDGWVRGCREIADSDGEHFRRTLLLSDGQANEGLTNLDEIATHVRELAARDISTSCFGIGLGYNEHLLEAMANAGGGSFHFLEALSAIPLAFEREFDELIHTALSGAELSLELPDGVGCTVSAGWPSTQVGSTFRTTIGGLYGGRELLFYFTLQFDGSHKGKQLRIPLTLRATDPESKPVTIESAITLTLAKADEEHKAEADRKLLERFALVDMADRATEALKMARAGRRREAGEFLGQGMQQHHLSMPSEQISKYRHISDQLKNGMDERTFKRRHQEEYANKRTRADVQDYRLREVNGHMLAEIGGDRVLIDSGIPVSLGRNDEWFFMQRLLPLLPAYLNVDMDTISGLVGEPLDIIIGADILAPWCVQFDLPRGRIAFSTRPMLRGGHSFPLSVLMGVPIVNVDVRGAPQRAFLDTGAKLSYAAADLLQGLTPVGHEQDFYPMLGTFETDVYQVPMSLGDLSFTLRCGALPPLLEATLAVAGKQVIIGVDLFRQFQVELDMERNRVTLAQ